MRGENGAGTFSVQPRFSTDTANSTLLHQKIIQPQVRRDQVPLVGVADVVMD